MARKKPKSGDVFTVPRESGGVYLLVYISSNRWGDAFGVLRGHQPNPDIDAIRDFEPLPYALHTGTRFITNGRWKNVGNRVELQQLFPTAPEIFHSKRDNPDNEMIGKFGSAETSSGQLRALTKEEADLIDIDVTYRQIVLEEQLESILHSLLG